MLGFGLEGAEVANPCLPAAVSHILGHGGSALVQQGEPHESGRSSHQAILAAPKHLCELAHMSALG